VTIDGQNAQLRGHWAYTEALLATIPIPDPRRMRVRQLSVVKGEAASALDATAGCPLRTRCPHRMTVCDQVTPELLPALGRHEVACFLHTPAPHPERKSRRGSKVPFPGNTGNR